MHIVFDVADAATLKKSFEPDEQLASEVLVLEDDWSIGPLKNVLLEDKEITRREWFAAMGVQLSDPDPLQQITAYLNADENATVTIWIAPNSRDVCGYYKLVTDLQQYKGRLFNIWLNNLPFINEKMQVFYPNFLKEIQPSEFIKARKLALEISASTFETDPDEWNKLVEENDLLRISDGGKKVTGKPVDFFDKEIIAAMQNDWQKVNRVINTVNSKSKNHPPVKFLLWRVREMAGNQRLEARGDWPSTENFEIRKHQAQPQSETGNE